MVCSRGSVLANGTVGHPPQRGRSAPAPPAWVAACAVVCCAPYISQQSTAPRRGGHPPAVFRKRARVKRVRVGFLRVNLGCRVYVSNCELWAPQGRSARGPCGAPPRPPARVPVEACVAATEAPRGALPPRCLGTQRGDSAGVRCGSTRFLGHRLRGWAPRLSCGADGARRLGKCAPRRSAALGAGVRPTAVSVLQTPPWAPTRADSSSVTRCAPRAVPVRRARTAAVRCPTEACATAALRGTLPPAPNGARQRCSPAPARWRPWLCRTSCTRRAGAPRARWHAARALPAHAKAPAACRFRQLKPARAAMQRLTPLAPTRAGTRLGGG